MRVRGPFPAAGWKDALAAINRQCEQVDGFAPFDEQTVLDVAAGALDSHIWVIDDGDAADAVSDLRGAYEGDGTQKAEQRRENAPDTEGHEKRATESVSALAGAPLEVAGLAHLGRAGTVELAVRPDARRRGYGRVLARKVHADLFERDSKTRGVDPRAENAVAGAWAHGDLPAAARLASEFDLTVRRALLVLQREIAAGEEEGDGGGSSGAGAFGDGAGAAPTRETVDEDLATGGFRLRTLDPRADLEAFTALNAAAFASHPEQGQLTEADMRQRFEQSWFDPDLCLLAVADGGELQGFIWFKPEEVPSEYELYVLGVAPSAQGHGVGAALTTAGLRLIAGRGARLVRLYADADNTAAVSLYQRMGFATAQRHVLYG
ncbi:GNAT family N-acetyltransferase [Actinobaculum sp. 313]|uniref:GNAT family N-acetyltransferase n=1 Tax=Actinobaculum sp. 313 TaxID=2495645 RepID=UPI000D5263D4|nr:GNAT family N-acetyltransferase [Actinobaculum sp. 313]AWE43044.1 hypothetical protein DDD63_10175 [Actinobaculum sp. 313]